MQRKQVFLIYHPVGAGAAQRMGIGQSAMSEMLAGLRVLLGTAALLTMGGQLPVLAQAAIQEPGAYAFYQPGGDVLNAGRPKPRYALLNQM